MSPGRLSHAARAALFWLFVLAIAGHLIARAAAHEWYPHDCCSDRDCWVAGPGGAEPEPRMSPAGWVLHDGTLIPFYEARPSPDGKFHVCRTGGSTLGKVIRAGDRPCLWVPMGGV